MYISIYIIAIPKRYSIAEARSNLPTIVDQAEAGAEVELTRRGKPVAVIISHRHMESLRGDRPRFGDSYRAFLRKYSVQDIGIENDFFQTVREKRFARSLSKRPYPRHGQHQVLRAIQRPSARKLVQAEDPLGRRSGVARKLQVDSRRLKLASFTIDRIVDKLMPRDAVSV